MKYATLALITFAVTGCASMTEIDGLYQGTDAGAAIVALAATKDTKFEEYYFSYRRVSGESEFDNGHGSIRLVTSNLFTKEQTDIDTPEESGNVFTLLLSPGDYEFYSFSAKRANRSWRPTQPFSIPFTVNAKQTSYVGHLRAQETHGRNFFNMPMEAGVFFYFEDQLEADVKIARERGDSFSSQLQNATPSIERIGSPLFVAPKH